MARAIRVRSCSMEVSLSSKRGGSWAARRATEFFAMSQAICTWRVSGNMSGASRAASSTPGSNLRCVAWASPFSRIRERLPRMFANTSTESACIEIFMRVSFRMAGEGRRAPIAERLAQLTDRACSTHPSGCGDRYSFARYWRACFPGETIPNPETGIEAAMNLIWTPAQLAMLAKVVDLNGFSAAARALAVPKAAVSRAVADLEKTLGVRVLERTTRRISLTSAGRLLYPHARRVGEETDAARSAIAKLQSPEARPLRVVADPTYGRVLLAPLVPRFLEAFAHVPLEVALDAQQLAAGAWDVAIRTRPPADDSVTQRLLGAPPALLCATPAYLQQRGMPARPDDLRSHDLLTPDAAELPEFRLLLERGAQRAEVPLTPKLAVDDPAVLHAATAAGLGIGLLPEFLCRQGLATGRLKLVLSEWAVPAAAALYALYPTALESDPRAQQFVDFLAANIVPALSLPAAARAPAAHPRAHESGAGA